MTIRVLLADDHPAVRAELRAVLQRDARIQIVGEANGGESAVRMALDLLPDLVLLDVSMPKLNGVLASLRILEETRASCGKAIQLVAVSLHNETWIADRLFEAGVKGYVIKNRAARELLPAIRAVMAGSTFVSDGLLHRE